MHTFKEAQSITIVDRERHKSTGSTVIHERDTAMTSLMKKWQQLTVGLRSTGFTLFVFELLVGSVCRLHLYLGTISGSSLECSCLE